MRPSGADTPIWGLDGRRRTRGRHRRRGAFGIPRVWITAAGNAAERGSGPHESPTGRSPRWPTYGRELKPVAAAGRTRQSQQTPQLLSVAATHSRTGCPSPRAEGRRTRPCRGPALPLSLTEANSRGVSTTLAGPPATPPPVRREDRLCQSRGRNAATVTVDDGLDRRPWSNWDDIGVLHGRSRFPTDRQEWRRHTELAHKTGKEAGYSWSSAAYPARRRMLATRRSGAATASCSTATPVLEGHGVRSRGDRAMATGRLRPRGDRRPVAMAEFTR